MTQEQALSIMKIGAHVFLTGEPGSGKTHTTNILVSHLRSKNIPVAVTASTGIAATHIGGMTIHSWSGIGVKTKLDKHDLDMLAKSKYVAPHVRKAQVLIIDEISMLSAQTFSLVDAVCRKLRKNPLPFGSLQVICVGDFFQLPPINKNEAVDSPQMSLVQDGRARFAYESVVWKEMQPRICYLTEQYRQDDREYIQLLSAMRRNMVTHDHVRILEKKKITEDSAPRDIPKLFSHNIDVDRVNSEILESLPGGTRTYTMTSHGHERTAVFLQRTCLSPYELHLKKGAAVMFTKNNPKEGFVNGTLGIVDGFDRHTGYPEVKIRNGRSIVAEPMDWIMEEYGEVRARITQIPLRLAWALTVHKSQGMSLDGAVIDLRRVFEFGQGYVALSRVRRLDGLHLLGWNERAFHVHPDVLAHDSFFRAQSELLERQPLPVNSAHATSVIPEKENGYSQIRQKHPKAYLPWDEEQDNELRELYESGASIKDLAKEFSRSGGSIRSRLIKLGSMQAV